MLISLLNSRRNVAAQKPSDNSIDIKRQMIQEQLEMVRKQKEHLMLQQQPHQQHQFQSYQEVDTPISERNHKANNSGYNNKQLNLSAKSCNHSNPNTSNNNNNKTNLNDISSSFFLK